MAALIPLIEKFGYYLIVGLANTTTCIIIMYLGALWGLNYLIYTALGYFIAILFSFFMNLHYTFRAEGDILKRLSLFFFVSLTNLLLVEIIEFTLVESFSMAKPLAIFLGMSWYTLSGFLINNFVVYKHQTETIV